MNVAVLHYIAELHPSIPFMMLANTRGVKFKGAQEAPSVLAHIPALCIRIPMGPDTLLRVCSRE